MELSFIGRLRGVRLSLCVGLGLLGVRIDVGNGMVFLSKMIILTIILNGRKIWLH